MIDVLNLNKKIFLAIVFIFSLQFPLFSQNEEIKIYNNDSLQKMSKQDLIKILLSEKGSKVEILKKIYDYLTQIKQLSDSVSTLTQQNNDLKNQLQIKSNDIIKIKQEKIDSLKELRDCIENQKKQIIANNDLLKQNEELNRQIIELRTQFNINNSEIILVYQQIKDRNEEILQLKTDKKDLLVQLMKPWQMKRFEFVGSGGFGIAPNISRATELAFQLSMNTKFNIMSGLYIFASVDWYPTFSLPNGVLNLYATAGIGFRLVSNN